MRNILIGLLVLCFAAMAQAQAVTITFQWDASATVGTTDNPVKYKLYRCTDAAATICVAPLDAGTALTLAVPSVAAGTSYWYCTAYQNGIVADGAPQGVLESGKSNILKLIVNVPPGNPANIKVRSFSVP